MSAQGDKRNSLIESFMSDRPSLCMSTATIDSETLLPPPIHFTTTIHDPPMSIRRDPYVASQYLQPNLKYCPLNSNNDDEINTEKNCPYDPSWVPEPPSSSPILSKFAFFESAENGSPSPLNSSKSKRKVTFAIPTQIRSQSDESQFASTSNPETLSSDVHLNVGLLTNEQGEIFKPKNKLKTWKELWSMPWKDEETKRFTKKFWFTFSITFCLVLILAVIGICLYAVFSPKTFKKDLSNDI
ncbi:1909_t:CDS:2 [Funneliformis mosseae]|uniref:1909_t:CDS:1 n=1 Tax=Funneliformis mosseae TaxID=27381 RepID=A0A9N8V233_FUNMO|nr:1909_t:CDS:2 [Funneliformis mosseae]